MTAHVDFTIDDLAFASSTLSAVHKRIIDGIARDLCDGTAGLPPLDHVREIVLTGFSSGTNNLELHANRRAAAVRDALSGALQKLGVGANHLAKIRIADPVTKLVASASQSSGKDRKVVISILSAAPARTVDFDLVFVTQGDTRPFIDNQDVGFSVTGVHTTSEIWQRRARDLPLLFDGIKIEDEGAYPLARQPDGRPNLQIESISDIHDASMVIDKLARDVRLRNVFFLGHGSAADGFAFSGRPSGPDPLHALVDGEGVTLTVAAAAKPRTSADKHAQFFHKIVDHLPSGYVGIWFLACFVGGGELPHAVAKLMSDRGRKEFFVGAYKNFYETQVAARLAGSTTVAHEIGGKTVHTSVPVMQRFSHWEDRILDGTHPGHVLIRSIGKNHLPRFEGTDGRGQFFIDALMP